MACQDEFCLTILLMSKKMMTPLTLLFSSLAFFSLGEFGLSHSNTRIWLLLSSMNACLIIAQASVALF
jgi:hypothetical protein